MQGAWGCRDTVNCGGEELGGWGRMGHHGGSGGTGHPGSVGIWGTVGTWDCGNGGGGVGARGCGDTGSPGSAAVGCGEAGAWLGGAVVWAHKTTGGSQLWSCSMWGQGEITRGGTSHGAKVALTPSSLQAPPAPLDLLAPWVRQALLAPLGPLARMENRVPWAPLVRLSPPCAPTPRVWPDPIPGGPTPSWPCSPSSSFLQGCPERKVGLGIGVQGGPWSAWGHMGSWEGLQTGGLQWERGAVWVGMGKHRALGGWGAEGLGTWWRRVVKERHGH